MENNKIQEQAILILEEDEKENLFQIMTSKVNLTYKI